MASQQLGRLRSKIDQLNLQILELLNERGRLVQEVGNLKEVQGVKRFDPVRERNMLDLIAENNNGPFETSTLQHIFKQIFQAGLELQEDDHRKALLVSRKKKQKIRLLKLKVKKLVTEISILLWDRVQWKVMNKYVKLLKQ